LPLVLRVLCSLPGAIGCLVGARPYAA
jgi:hypothetical protein